MNAFKAYDFRGKFEEDFTLEDVYKIGYFLPELLNTRKILVGRDARLSSPGMFEALARGIVEAGADVYDMGLCTTPMVYYFTAKHHFEASVMITASHNPKEYNGLKISRANALPVGYDTGLATLEKWLTRTTPKPVLKQGKIINYPVKAEYLSFLSRYQYDISNLNMVIDCSNGMASLLVKDIFGQKPIYLYDILDGHFPNHEANPLEMKNVKDLSQKVTGTFSDIGVIFDGDADRVMFVDEHGKFIPPDLLIAVLAHYYILEKHEEGQVIMDIRTSKSVSEYIEKMGCEPYIWRVGRAYAALKLREINGSFGGEFAGHYYSKYFFYSDSAMLAALLILHVFSQMKTKGISVSALISRIAVYANSGELNFKIANKEGAIETVKKHFLEQEKALKIMDFDGYRIEFESWWFNIRPSNTEPYLRLLVEARTQELLTLKINEIENILRQFA
ncbi:MAG: phosphomannomutase/phosphoglucomutase [Bacteroidales bacterium]|jgi:phosphomannomutase|nr:phosphomannomutase/phosphoglucomutase [Bacteroidales bacterium]